jgi:acetyl-CoA C-acetyltransferase
MARDALLIDGVRSPRGRGKETGSLHEVHPQELLGQVLEALRERAGFDVNDVEDIVMGNGSMTGDHGSDIARLAALTAGWPLSAAGTTLNRFCGSGQQAVTFAAMAVMSGHQELVIGGGVESMSRWNRTAGSGLTDGDNPKFRERYPVVPQGISADLIATIDGFSRDDVDSFAVQSQERCEKAMAEGRFERSVIPIYNNDGSLALDHDEHPRAGTTKEGLAKLKPSFAEQGTTVLERFGESFDDMCRRMYPDVGEINHVHHAGNSSGVVDGAGAIAVASSDYVKANGLQARAKLVMSAVAGSEPVIMLTAPGPAAQIALRKAGMSTSDIDLWEINEAFAVVPLKTMRDLELDPDRVNVNGGAIALGHPIGASGPMLIQTALDELERTDKSTALICMCTGAGMGTATIIERV